MKTEHAVDKAQFIPPPTAAQITWNETVAADKAQGRWSLVPRALHFNIMCDGKVIYEGVTSESQGIILCDHHNAALAAEREHPCAWCESERDEVLQQLAAEREAYALALQMKNIETTRANQAEQQLAEKEDLWDRASRQADTLAEYLVDAKAELSVTKTQLAEIQISTCKEDLPSCSTLS